MKKLLFWLASAALFATASIANADTFTTTKSSAYSVGDEIGSDFDIFKVNPNGLFKQSFSNSVGSFNQVIGSYFFEVGVNCITCETTTGSTSFKLYLNGVTSNFAAVVLPWTWSSSGPIDTLTFGQPAPLHFALGNGKTLTISNILVGTGVVSSGSGQVTGDITAHFAVAAVPEPADWAMFIAGLGLMAGVIRRRKAQNA